MLARSASASCRRVSSFSNIKSPNKEPGLDFYPSYA